MSLDCIIKSSLKCKYHPNIDNSIINIEPTLNKTYISQQELMNAIHTEFQKDFIKNLYKNPIWTERVYWNVIGKIQNENENIPLDDIISGVNQYLSDNKMCICQIDLLKFIHDSILFHQVDGKTQIKDVYSHATENGITSNRFNEAIKRMKAEGIIFEPAEGFYKCI